MKGGKVPGRISNLTARNSEAVVVTKKIIAHPGDRYFLLVDT